MIKKTVTLALICSLVLGTVMENGCPKRVLAEEAPVQEGAIVSPVPEISKEKSTEADTVVSPAAVQLLKKDTGNAPKLKCLDESITSIEEGMEVDIPYSYEDDMGMQKINLYYKTSSENKYTCEVTTSFRVEGKYFVRIPSDKLLHQEYVDYYLEGFNRYRSTKTEVKRIKIKALDDFTGIRTNLSDGAYVSQNVLITARDKSEGKVVSIAVDGKTIEPVNLLEKGAFFTLNYKGIDSYYKNAVSVGRNILTYMAKWSNILASKAVFVDQSYFTYHRDGSAEVTVSLWAGSEGSAFEIGTDVNNDDYKASGFHLVLTDGTVLNPDNGVDPNREQKMGDSKGMTERLDVHFTVPEDKVDALGYVWDTSSVEDGLHNITVTSTKEEKKIQVMVDNSPPEISAEIKTNKQLNNQCRAEIQVSDCAGINYSTLEVYLNDKKLKEPYTFTGAVLSEGNNILTVKAMDTLGNQGMQMVSFTYRNGRVVVSNMTESGANKDSIHLSAMLGDEIDNKTTVTFQEGKRLEIGEEISVWNGIGDKTGSSVPGSLGTITSENGQYPYQMYQIRADGAKNDILQVKVDAKASYNRPVQLYVYNVRMDYWELLKINEAGGIKKAEFELEDHIQNGIAKVLVQARGTESAPTPEVAENPTVKSSYYWDGKGVPEQYDFSFAWITDTQFYTETWKDSFTAMNQWIIDSVKKLKIKYLIHTGDIVDEFDQKDQWECMDKNMNLFEKAGLPYGILGGNHDVAAGNELFDNYNKYCSENRFKNYPFYGESYRNNLGHYDLITVHGEELILLYMSWDTYKDEIDWMNEVLKKFSDRKAILCFHRYLSDLGKLDYTGDMVQKQVVAKNPNVFAVLNGHYHGASINVAAFDDNKDGIKERKVYQICTDYQCGEKGGGGYVKMLYFDLANGKIYVNSYSNEFNDYNFYDADKLCSYDEGIVVKEQDISELDVDFNRRSRSLITSSVEVALFTNKTIGTAESTNGIAEMDWTELVHGKKYGWYSSVKDEQGLIIRGEINEFNFLPVY